MLHLNRWAVVVAAVAAFLVGAIWYSPLLFGEAYVALLRRAAPAALVEMGGSPGEIAGEFLRGLVVASVLAHVMQRTRAAGWRASLRLGLLTWVGFQATLLLGAVLHENMPWGLYGIHAGDALVKTASMSVILGVWRPAASVPMDTTAVRQHERGSPL